MQRHRFLLLCASIAGLAILGCFKSGSGPASSSELRPLTVDQVAAKLTAGDGKTFIYDNNDKESWVDGHVPGAKWVDSEHVTAADLPADRTATLIFYCHNEAWHACHTAAVAAEKLGYANVYIMPQGIVGWKNAGKPIEKGAPG